MKALANEIYNVLLDMDYLDYQETQEDSLKALMDDLELLQEQGNGTLLNVVKMLVE